MSEWQPIETAQREGAVLVFSPSNKRAFIAEFNPGGDAWVGDANDTLRLEVTGTFSSGGGWFQWDEITHWMPLPMPPSDSGSNPQG